MRLKAVHIKDVRLKAVRLRQKKLKNFAGQKDIAQKFCNRDAKRFHFLRENIHAHAYTRTRIKKRPQKGAGEMVAGWLGNDRGGGCGGGGGGGGGRFVKAGGGFVGDGHGVNVNVTIETENIVIDEIGN